MAITLNERDKRALIWMGSAAAVILGMIYVIQPFFDHWRGIRAELRLQRDKIQTVSGLGEGAQAKQKGLASVVPVFEMPETTETQMVRFREKFNEQLKQTGVNVTKMQFRKAAKVRSAGRYKVLTLDCQGSCQLNQMFDLLAKLYENPHCAGVEELKLACDEKNRQQVSFNLSVSTFAK